MKDIRLKAYSPQDDEDYLIIMREENADMIEVPVKLQVRHGTGGQWQDIELVPEWESDDAT
jgi:hypothetical protein